HDARDLASASTCLSTPRGWLRPAPPCSRSPPREQASLRRSTAAAAAAAATSAAAASRREARAGSARAEHELADHGLRELGGAAEAREPAGGRAAAERAGAEAEVLAHEVERLEQAADLLEHEAVGEIAVGLALPREPARDHEDDRRRGAARASP